MKAFFRGDRLALFSLFLVFAGILGCSSAVQEMRVKTAPDELYNNANSAYMEERFEDAERGFKAVMEEHPLSPFAVEAQLMLGDLYYAMERYEEAGSYYTTFSSLHPGHPRAAYALFQKGMSIFKDVLSADRDQTATKKALFAFEDLLRAHPDTIYTQKAKELRSFLKARLAERELYIARFYFKNKNYKAALTRLRDILRDYPEAGFSEEALYFIGESYARLGESELAKDAFSTLVANYPQGAFAKDARERLKGS
jgi:outer membrane protein assembly factor BamD